MFGASFTGSGGRPEPLEMGCYGIGVSRVLAASVEALSSETELRWPPLLAPFTVCLLAPKAGSREAAGTTELQDQLYNQIHNIFPNDVVVDDREKMTIGRKQHEAYRTGFPLIVVVGKKSVDPDPMVELHVPAEDRRVELRPVELVQYLHQIRTKYTI